MTLVATCYPERIEWCEPPEIFWLIEIPALALTTSATTADGCDAAARSAIALDTGTDPDRVYLQLDWVVE